MGFQAEISVDLPPTLRGIHMSRIEEAISALYPMQFRDLRHYAHELSVKILENQEGCSCSVKLHGSIPHIWFTSVSNRKSVDSVRISTCVEALQRNESVEMDMTVGLGLHHMTACPCTQIYTRTIFEQDKNGAAPMPTHSQRSETILTIQDRHGNLLYDDLFNCLCSSLHITQDLLKRPDEAEMVLNAHNTPQFAEDVVRSVAASCNDMFAERLEKTAEIKIQSESQESIHSHNVLCCLETTVSELGNWMLASG